MAATAWIWWLSGGAIAAAGLGLLWWSLFRDRARGRRRCPKCWYDMAGVPGLVCPECGRDAAREKKLAKTRRRWRLAVIGVSIALAGGAALCAPTARRYGFRGVIPTSVLLLLAPTVSETRVTSDSPIVGAVEEFLDSLLSELALRAQDPRRGLSDRQWRMFVVRKQVIHAWRESHNGSHVVVQVNDQSFMERIGQYVITDPLGPDRPAPSQTFISTGTDDGPWHMFRRAASSTVENAARESRLAGSIEQRVAEVEWIEVNIVYRVFIDTHVHTVLEPPRVVWSGTVRIPIQESEPRSASQK